MVILWPLHLNIHTEHKRSDQTPKSLRFKGARDTWMSHYATICLFWYSTQVLANAVMGWSSVSWTMGWKRYWLSYRVAQADYCIYFDCCQSWHTLAHPQLGQPTFATKQHFSRMACLNHRVNNTALQIKWLVCKYSYVRRACHAFENLFLPPPHPWSTSVFGFRKDIRSFVLADVEGLVLLIGGSRRLFVSWLFCLRRFGRATGAAIVDELPTDCRSKDAGLPCVSIKIKWNLLNRKNNKKTTRG